MTAPSLARSIAVEGRPLPAVDNWAPETPAEERALYAAAWQAHRSCRDCRWWGDADPTQGIACCGSPGNRSLRGSFLTPEDFTCAEFEDRPRDAAGGAG